MAYYLSNSISRKNVENPSPLQYFEGIVSHKTQTFVVVMPASFFFAPFVLKELTIRYTSSLSTVCDRSLIYSDTITIKRFK